MTLLLPAGIRQIAADPAHPYYHPEMNGKMLAIFLDGEEVVATVIVADEVNGYIRCLSTDVETLNNKRRTQRFVLPRLKGFVQIYIRKEPDNVD